MRLGSSLVLSVLTLSIISSFTILLHPTPSANIVDATRLSDIDERIKERLEQRPTICIGVCPTGPPGPSGPPGPADWNPSEEVARVFMIQSPVDLETGMSIEGTFWNPTDNPNVSTSHAGGECSSYDMNTSTDRFRIGCRSSLSGQTPVEGSTLTYIITK